MEHSKKWEQRALPLFHLHFSQSQEHEFPARQSQQD
jgi:hypothetical protein